MKEEKPAKASTVMVLRDPGKGLEVLCMQRGAELSAWGGAVVFPGGKLDETDFDPSFLRCTTEPDPGVNGFGDSPEVERASVVAAARECFEEACLLPVQREIGHGEVLALRESYQKESDFCLMLEKGGLMLDLGCFIPIARWVTPQFQRIRFDARFYVMDLPAGQKGFNFDKENTECFWSQPGEILERFKHGNLDLVPVTQWMLDKLSKYNSLDTIYAFARRQNLTPVCPELYERNGLEQLVLPGHTDHSQYRRFMEGPYLFKKIRGRFVLNW